MLLLYCLERETVVVRFRNFSNYYVNGRIPGASLWFGSLYTFRSQFDFTCSTIIVTFKYEYTINEFCHKIKTQWNVAYQIYHISNPHICEFHLTRFRWYYIEDKFCNIYVNQRNRKNASDIIGFFYMLSIAYIILYIIWLLIKYIAPLV